jgi:RNA polymerase sigma factor (sigma-70 family)
VAGLLDYKAFPVTRYSVVAALRSGNAEVRKRAFETLVASYWKPVYKYVRLRWKVGKEDAEDLTQEFFAVAFEKDYLGEYDASRARFRTFLRTCVDRLVMNAQKASSRLKRGGGLAAMSVDFMSAEDELRASASPDPDMDAFFRDECIRALFELAVARLRSECQETGKTRQFSIFERYDLASLDSNPRPTYGKLAGDFGIPETQVTNFLAFSRRHLRLHVLQVLAELTATDEEMAAEVREVLGWEE